MSRACTAAALRRMLTDGGEIALLDVREEAAFGRRHLLYASSAPLSRLELRIAALVPRLSVRLVVCDEEDGLARRAAARLEALGYTGVRRLEGGVDAWAAAGFELFSGLNVPSKGFGEAVEHGAGTPSISAAALATKLDAGEDVVVLDSRPWDEYRVMSIPTGICVPGAELVHRFADLVPSPETLVVVNCAGRTRSIIGAQSLIDAGVPNRIVALENGTMGWHLAGLDLERGGERRAPPPSGPARAAGARAAAGVRARFGVRSIDRATFESWRSDADRRSLYLLDVRSPEEYERGHLPDAVSAPGGQLVQATDGYVATLGARLVLVDDTGVRATMTASWLGRLGWSDTVVLEDGLIGETLRTGPYRPPVLGIDPAAADEVSPGTLSRRLDAGSAVVVDLATSREYRRGHVPGAWHAIRSRLAQALPVLPAAATLVLTSQEGTLARVAAPETSALARVPVRVLAGGTAGWEAAGYPLASGDERFTGEPDDVWLRPYDRAGGVEAAMRDYLDWEVDLVEQIRRDGTARFELPR